MDYEQRYKEALDNAKVIHKTIRKDLKPVIEQIFPELIESEDKRIKREIIQYIKTGTYHEDWIDWIEQQGEINKSFYEIAEKEKRQFVSYGFIKCYANLQDFKEGETYWLEYIGNDNYIVRSDNLLGKTYHITPCQLYTVFKKLTWLEKQGEQKLVVPKFKVGDIVKDIEDGEIFTIKTVTKDKYIYTDDSFDWIKDQDTYVLVEQKSIDKVEPKFNLYDWVVTDKGDVVQIGAVNNGYYTLFNGMDFNMSYVDKCWHLWTNQDIKDGDILCTYECGKPKIIFILKTTSKNPYILKYHCYYNIMYPYFEPNSETGCLAVNDGDLKPATKEQRDTLFEKMKLEGYRWDEDEKKVIRFERFVRRKESDFAFKEDENGVIKFVHKS